MAPSLLDLFPPHVLFIGFGCFTSDESIYTIETIYGGDLTNPNELILFSKHPQEERFISIRIATTYRVTRGTGILSRFKGYRVCLLFKESGLAHDQMIFLILDKTFNDKEKGSLRGIAPKKLAEYFLRVHELMEA